MKVSATILCPTYNHGILLRAAIRSVLRQSLSDWELFLIGDGVTPETREVIEEILTWDSRIIFVDKPKSLRHGEPYRHEVLTHHAQGEFIFYLGDDDLWLPHHLESLIPLLASHDIAHSRHAQVSKDGKISSHFVHWCDPEAIQWTLCPPKKNGVGLSQVAHRLDFYQRLPHGWRTTPKGDWSDHYMWQQMLNQLEVRATCSMLPTALQFPAPYRVEMSLTERYQELETWAYRMEIDLQNLYAEISEAVRKSDVSQYFQGDVERRRLSEEIVELQGTHETTLNCLKALENQLARKELNIANMEAQLTIKKEEAQRAHELILRLSSDNSLLHEGVLSERAKKLQLRAKVASMIEEIKQLKEKNKTLAQSYRSIPKVIRSFSKFIRRGKC